MGTEFFLIARQHGGLSVTWFSGVAALHAVFVGLNTTLTIVRIYLGKLEVKPLHFVNTNQLEQLSCVISLETLGSLSYSKTLTWTLSIFIKNKTIFQQALLTSTGAPLFARISTTLSNPMIDFVLVEPNHPWNNNSNKMPNLFC